MPDIAISYSSKNRSDALHVRDSLTTAGLDVWMDDAAGQDGAAGLASVGIAAGARHWDVISEFFLESSLIVFLDSNEFRASEYCKREYDYVEQAHKRIAVVRLVDTAEAGGPQQLFEPQANVDASTVDEVIDQFPVGKALAEAHSRLLVADRSGVALGSGLRGVPESLVMDARTVLNASSGVNDDESTAAYARRIVDRDIRWHRGRNSTATVALCIVLALVLAAGWAFRLASESRQRAMASDETQRSQLLALQSTQASDTWTQTDLASQAVAAFHTPQATAALDAARTQSKQVQHTTITADSYWAATMSADGNYVALMTRSRVVLVSLVDGKQVASVDVPKILGSTLAVTSDGSHAVVEAVSADGSELALFDVDFLAGTASQIPSSSANGFTISADGSLWWTSSESNTTIYRLTQPWLSGSRQSYSGDFDYPTAISVNDDEPSVLLMEGNTNGGQGYLDQYSIQGNALELISSSAIFPDSFVPDPPRNSPGSGTDGWTSDLILQCNAGTAAVRNGALVWLDAATGAITDDSTSDMLVLRRMGGPHTPPACLPGGAVKFQSVFQFSDTIPSGLANPVAPLTSGGGVYVTSPYQMIYEYLQSTTRADLYAIGGLPDGSRLALVSMTGDLYIITTANAIEEQSVDAATSLFSLPGGPYLMSGDGSLFVPGSTTPVATLPFVPPAQHPAMSDGSAYVTDGHSLARITATDSSISIDWCTFGAASTVMSLNSATGGIGVTTRTSFGVIAVPQGSSGQDCQGAWTTVTGLRGGEALLNSAFAGAVVVASTSYGRVLVVDVTDGSITASTTQGVGGMATAVAFTTDGSIVALSGDGRLVRYDQNLLPAASQALPGATTMFMSPDGQQAYIYFGNGGLSFAVYDATSLELLQILPAATVGNYLTPGLDAADHRFYVLATSTDQDGTVSASLVDYPLLFE